MMPAILSFDIDTWKLLSLAVMTVSLLTAFSFWRRWDYRDGPDFWILGATAYFLVFFLMLFQDLVPLAILGIGKDLFITASALWFLRGIRTMMGRHNYPPVEAGLMAITLLVSLMTHALFPDSPAGPAIIALIAGNIAVFSAITLFRSRDYSVLSVRSVCMAFFLLFAIVQFGFVLLSVSAQNVVIDDLIDEALVISGFLISAITFSLIAAAGSLTDVLNRNGDNSGRMPDNDNKWLKAMEFSDAGSWELNLETGDIDVSGQWKKLLGYPESALFNNLEEYINLVHPDDRDNLLLDRYAMNRRANDVFSNQHRMKTQSGKWLWIQSRGRKLTAEKSGNRLLIISDIDINERKASESLMREAIAKAEQANRSKSVFLANMSHEIRTPMNSILGFTQLMMEDETMGQQQKENLEIINKSSQHLLELIDGILDLSRIEAGREELQKGPVDLIELMNDVTAMFRHQGFSENVAFELTLANDLPRYIITDSGKLRQICTNLLSNAFKFTEKGTVRLLASGERTSANLFSLDISVIDTGRGISVEEQEYVFTFMGDLDTDTQSGESHGLGLVISKSLSHLLGGDLTFHCELRKGCHFKLNIPVKLQEGTEEDSPLMTAERNRKNIASTNSRNEVQKVKKVLVVDEQVHVREMVSRILSTLDIEISQAASANDALQIIEFWQPDLILIDIDMPGLTDNLAISEIRINPDWDHIPVIAITDRSSGGDPNRLRGLGAADFIDSPISREQLVRKVSGTINRNGPPAQYAGNPLHGKTPTGK